MIDRRGPFFTEKARAAAAEARKRRAAEKQQSTREVDVFVARVGTGFGWEIRRFGCFVLDRSDKTYPSMAAARSDGARVLRSQMGEVSHRGPNAGGERARPRA